MVPESMPIWNLLSKYFSMQKTQSNWNSFIY